MTASSDGGHPRTPGPLILVIEDEPQVRRFLRATLGSHGYRLVEVTTGQEALAQATTRIPDVVLLDLGLPDLDGIEVVGRLREWATMPIIVVSARGKEEDKIHALDAGADDYLTKPFGAGELLARIRVALRNKSRSAAPEEPVFTAGDLRVDAARRQVFVADREVHLTPIEYKLLQLLVRNAGRVMTHRQLLEQVWGPAHAGHAHYLRVFMGQLRQKLETEPARPRWLVTEPGVGYRLRAD